MIRITVNYYSDMIRVCTVCNVRHAKLNKARDTHVRLHIMNTDMHYDSYIYSYIYIYIYILLYLQGQLF